MTVCTGTRELIIAIWLICPRICVRARPVASQSLVGISQRRLQRRHRFDRTLDEVQSVLQPVHDGADGTWFTRNTVDGCIDLGQRLLRAVASVHGNTCEVEDRSADGHVLAVALQAVGGV